LLLSLGDDRYLNVVRQPQDLRNKVLSPQPFELPGPGACEKNLRYLLPVGELDKGGGGVLSLQDSGIDVKIAGEVEVLLDGILFRWRQFREIPAR
jgi:hypothetical protein